MNKEHRLQPALDLRAFIEEVRVDGELEEVSAAHWNLEIGALTELFAEQVSTPALLFDDIPDYPKGRRVLSNVLYSPRRQALALGVAPELRGIPLVQEIKRRLAEMKPLPASEVQSAPVLQNVVAGNAVDVGKFPAPQWH